MKPSVFAKLEGLEERYEEVQALLGDPDTISNQDLFRALTKEYSQLETVVQCFNRYREALQDIETAQEMLKDDDPDMREMAQEEYKDAKQRVEEMTDELQILLLPKDPNDDNNAYLEIRAGAGGDEAAIFAGDLFRMYSRYAETKGWRLEIVNASEGEHGGFKEVVAKVDGEGVYGIFKFEFRRSPGTAGAGHRVPGAGAHLGLYGRGAGGSP